MFLNCQSKPRKHKILKENIRTLNLAGFEAAPIANSASALNTLNAWVNGQSACMVCIGIIFFEYNFYIAIFIHDTYRWWKTDSHLADIYSIRLKHRTLKRYANVE